MSRTVLMFIACAYIAHAQMPFSFSSDATRLPMFTAADSVKGWWVASDLPDSLSKADGDTTYIWTNRARWISPYNMGDLYQATAANKPSLAYDRGKPVVRFDGVNDMMASTLPVSYAQPASLFMVLRTRVVKSWYEKFFTGNGFTTWHELGIRDDRVYSYAGSELKQGVGSACTDSIYLYECVFDAGDTVVTRTTTLAGDAGAQNQIGAVVGSDVSSSSTSSAIDVYEIIYLHANGSPTLRGRVRNYLLTKYINPQQVVRHERRFVFDGNSITYGSYVNRDSTYPVQVRDSLLQSVNDSLAVINYGVAGQSIADMMVDTTTQIDPTAVGNKNYLIAFGGTNDIRGGADSTTTFNRLKQYCLGRQSKYKVFVLTCLPATPAGYDSIWFETNRQGFNRMVRARYTEFADVLIDVATDPLMGERYCELNQTYYLADRIHPSGDGYKVIASYVYQALLNNP